MKKKGTLLMVGAFMTTALCPTLGLAGNVKKVYVNVSKEGQQAQSSDIPSNYGQAESKVQTTAYEFISGKHGQFKNGVTYKKGEGLVFDGVDD